ncbi:P-loop containing nucleoside triphosphate hydrolase protein [Mycotypha africana]|uniref:P-loop containing nucleoside triphosphate hydrolase protein n=1 Tax=Mycotypha africana TaxID=64632 RepID=UPI0022FFCC32|nr:P-loop containing nucleoside triphosphate hydrolase protein [Mycotypha africana]KAI8968604.1 P-loop containing nucleoside triphosphate hydrolase protein [Mycotypha africana]
MPKALIVQFTPLKSCLVNLPSRWVNALLEQRKLPQNIILEITSSNGNDSTSSKTSADDRRFYCGWSGAASKPLQPNSVFTHGANGKLDVLELDSQLGTAFGLQEGQRVNVEFCRSVPDCATVSVEPLTEDDWEILELHAGYVEDNLLSQIRAVYANQIMCVWINGKTLVRLVVATLDPPKHDVLKLSNTSEVIVAPKVRGSKQPSNAEDVSDLSKAPTDENIQQQQLRAIMLRTCSAIGFDIKDKESVFVYVHPESIENLTINQKMPDVVNISKVIPTSIKNGSNNIRKREEEQQQQQQEMPKDILLNTNAVFAKIIPLNDIPPGHIILGSVLRATLKLKDFDIVKVSTTLAKRIPLGSLILRKIVTPAVASSPWSSSTLKLGLDSAQPQMQQEDNFQKEVKNSIRKWLATTAAASDKDFVLSQGLHFDFNVDDAQETFILQLGVKKGLFSLASDNDTTDSQAIERYAVISKVQHSDIPIEIDDDIQTPPLKEEEEKGAKEIAVLGGVAKVVQKIEQYTFANLAKCTLRDKLQVPGAGGILLTGAHGSGKSSIVEKILASSKIALIYTMTINCSEFADERIPVIRDLLHRWLDEAIWHGPSLIFFDDLDRLIPAEVEHADSTRSRHLAELFVRMTKSVCFEKKHSIMFIATAQQQQSIHTALITHHIFSQFIHLQPPNREERKQIMEAMMTANTSGILSRSLPGIDLVSVASETEGFLAADLKALIERTVHEGAIRQIRKKLKEIKTVAISDTEPCEDEKEQLKLIQEDFAKAREGFVPSSLRGVKLQSSGVNWTDIGGLNETRKTLLETLEWPTKYAAVFSQCPLRLRSGLLLYGYPGCGKTLLASAVAKECGLNFISVKGPEILNKYIGASEKSVRDLFERAQAAKPCILFFDEFDSIAPRRGHDSTGVTDRVVNQLLTQMDGAEGLDGVYVLAATSRPDLIDPALLRPGRLDKALLCGMPTLEERLEILQALSSKMHLAADVDLRVYAEKTEGFSGADLQGFLYNAHLEAIHGAIDMDTFKESQDTKQSYKSRDEKSEFVMNWGPSKKVALTLAEKGQISQRLAMIKKGVKQKQTDDDHPSTTDITSPPKEEEGRNASTIAGCTQEAIIKKQYLDKSLRSTRPSITAEEAYRLGSIYNEFVTGRTGELPSGEGDKGIGRRSTLG